VISRGARRVLLVATLAVGSSEQVQALLDEELAAQKDAHPQVEFVELPSPLETEYHARLLVDSLQQFQNGTKAADTIPLSLLPSDESGMVQCLNGGHEFVSRLAALGFIPGSRVKAVQNYGAGPLIVTVRGTRIALGREEARRVSVRLLRGRVGREQHRGRRHGRRKHFG
jgi:ferrous iron transport protein A